ncbi:MAG: molecular chaperone TorD family protein [Pseudomonadota bacterium]
MKSPTTLNSDLQPTILTGLRHLCRLFWGPDPAQCSEILAGRFFEPFAGPDSGGESGAVAALETIDRYLRTMPDANALFEALETSYVRLFISSRAGIGVPLYQSCYAFDGAPLMGPSAVRMQRRLEAVGLSLTGDASCEPPDHLAVELEYLYFLLEKGGREKDPALIAEAAVFAETELGAWIDAFERRLFQAPDSALYAPAAFLTGALVSRIAHDTTADGDVPHNPPEPSP